MNLTVPVCPTRVSLYECNHKGLSYEKNVRNISFILFLMLKYKKMSTVKHTECAKTFPSLTCVINNPKKTVSNK